MGSQRNRKKIRACLVALFWNPNPQFSKPRYRSDQERGIVLLGREVLQIGRHGGGENRLRRKSASRIHQHPEVGDPFRRSKTRRWLRFLGSPRVHSESEEIYSIIFLISQNTPETGWKLDRWIDSGWIGWWVRGDGYCGRFFGC